MRDFLGQDLEVDDYVVLISKGGRRLAVGVITGIAGTKFVNVSLLVHSGWQVALRQEPEQLLRIDPALVTAKLLQK